MYRLAWFLAGAVVGYIASGYIEGLTEKKREDTNDSPKQAEEAA